MAVFGPSSVVVARGDAGLVPDCQALDPIRAGLDRLARLGHGRGGYAQ